MNKDINNIPDTHSVTNNNRVDIGLNIKIDLFDINIKDILSYSLNYLKKLVLLDSYFEYNLSFENNYSLVRFEDVLSRYNKAVKLYIYNIEDLTDNEKKLLNLLSNYKSIWFNVVKMENKFTKTKLNYRNASPVPKIKEGVRVSSTELARLDKSIREKCKNNNPKLSREEVDNPSLSKKLKRN